MQRLGLFFQDRGAQDATGVTNHERDLLRRRFGRGHDQVTLIFAVIIVDHDHDLAIGNGRDDVFDRVKCRRHRVPPVSTENWSPTALRGAA